MLKLLVVADDFQSDCVLETGGEAIQGDVEIGVRVFHIFRSPDSVAGLREFRDLREVRDVDPADTDVPGLDLEEVRALYQLQGLSVSWLQKPSSSCPHPT